MTANSPPPHYINGIKMLRLSLFALLLAPMSANAQTPRDINGWQNVRFGMTIEQVLRAEPNAQLLKHFCGEHQSLFVSPGNACEEVAIQTANVAGLTWVATLRFSLARELTEVELSIEDRTRASLDTFASILSNLNAGYAANAQPFTLTTPQAWEAQCKHVRNQRAKGEPTRPIDFLIERQSRRAAIARPSGSVLLHFYERALCDAPELESIHAVAGPYLEITYSRRSITTTDGL